MLCTSATPCLLQKLLQERESVLLQHCQQPLLTAGMSGSKGNSGDTGRSGGTGLSGVILL